jgi:hypothetical protein
MAEPTCRVTEQARIWELPGGIRHREDGPAIERNDGVRSWWLNGKLHREGGPAKTYKNGHKYWYRNGQLHNPDGPAAIHPNGSVGWYLNGDELDPNSKDPESIRLVEIKAIYEVMYG